MYKKLWMPALATLIATFIIAVSNTIKNVGILEAKVEGQKEMIIEIRDDVKYIRDRLDK